MTTNQQPTGDGDIVVAAGGVLHRRGASGDLEVAVVHRTRYRHRDGTAGDWVLPKGKLDAGEGLEEAALREVREETGCTGRIVGPGRSLEYEAEGRPKRATYFPMACVAEGPVRDSAEVAECRWLTARDAAAQLTYEHEAEVLRAVLGLQD